MPLSSFLTPFCPVNPFFSSHPISFFSCFGSIANPLTPTDKSRKSSRRPGDADADAEFGDGDGCYGVEVRGMKGGQVVVVGWGLEGRVGEGRREKDWTRNCQNPKKTNPNPILPTPPPTTTPHFIPNLPHPKPIPSYQQHTQSEPSNRLFAKAKAIPTHKPCTQSPLHPSSIHHLTPTLTSTLFTHPQTIPLKTPFSTSQKLRKQLQNHPIHIIPSNHLFHPHAIYFAMKIS